MTEKSKYVLNFLWLLKQRISIAKLCFQMCFEFDSVSLTFIKYSDEYVIKVLCLFFNIEFSVLQTSFELRSDWTKEEGLPACSQARHAVQQHCACLWTQCWARPCACAEEHLFPMFFGVCFNYHKSPKWGIECFPTFICLSFCLNMKYQSFCDKEMFSWELTYLVWLQIKYWKHV